MKKLERRFNAIIRQCRRDLRGGLQYGMDYPTIAALWPERYAELKQISNILREKTK
jgi:hypothetical protein